MRPAQAEQPVCTRRRPSTLVVACGALGREVNALKKANNWQHLRIRCLPAELHNRPEQIPARLEAVLADAQHQYEQIFVAYADCGTQGEIDRVLARFESVERLPGPHCYATYAGQPQFETLSESEPGTLYLTDFLARHFRRFIVEPLKLDLHPELRAAFFGNYKRVVFLSQTHSPALVEKARDAADYLDLNFEQHHCGYGELETHLVRMDALLHAPPC